uniref:Uncharacterized protein n=1 Tax=viral metagenome TaxID=1070528 RepID=A0A6C0J694_9ZZZZ
MEQIQQLKEQIKLLEQEELEKKIEQEENDIEYNLGVLNKMISNRLKVSSGGCSIANKYLENLDMSDKQCFGYFQSRNLQSNGIQLNYILSKMLRIMVQMNEDISELKNKNQNKTSYFTFLEDYSKSNNMTLKEAMIDIKKKGLYKKTSNSSEKC